MSIDGTSFDYSQLTAVKASPTATTATKKNIDGALSQAQFLKLMTTQMTHQDPSQPMKNGEFLTQMAQFGTVSGIQDLQKSFTDFANKVTNDQALQASGLVGRSVMIEANQGVLETGKTISGNIDLTTSTNDLTIKITDPKTGDIVNTIVKGQQAKGYIPFSWDGTKADGTLADPGMYKIEAMATIDDKNTQLVTSIKSKVDSVKLGGSAGGITVNLSGGAGSVDFNKIQEIL